ncbi:MAG: dTDP-glucose 4,6-dehydratase [Candidatus Gracilibacteria bacterium]|nr:dTDP-glucose 4,6-dehydratase [Candidatus Gracilibacteria bacterium]
MKILVTGGAGFIGSNFIRYILGKYPEYEVVNFDKLTYAGNLDNLKGVEGTEGVDSRLRGNDKGRGNDSPRRTSGNDNSRYKFVKGDIADEKAVDELFAAENFDVILNYAAETHVDRSITGPRDFITTDIFGTFTLLEAVKKYGVKRYVQISTDEVFGSTEDGAFTEESSFMPNSPYSASKAGADHLCRAYFVTYGVPVIVTHSCNVYGPNQYPEKVIPLFVTNLLSGKKVPLYGDGKNVREWLYTEDHCSAIDAILHNGKIGEVYNIGSGHELANIELTQMILKNFGVGEEMIEYVEDRLGHDRRYSVDSKKLRDELGWKPRFEFEKTLSDTIDWYKNNKWWWEKLIG